mgnify:CR=1 FL=1
MAVEIKSGNGTDTATVDPVSKALHVINFSSDGHEGIHALPVSVATNNASALNEFVLPSLDAGEYAFISMQLVGTWEATVTFEGSNDNTTFYSIATTDPSANGTGQVTATINRVVKVPVLTQYIRARVSAYTSGTISAVAFGHRDENSSGLISTLGSIELQAETTKKIGNVGLEAGTNAIGSLSAGTAHIGDVKVLPTISAPPIPLKVISAVGVNATSVQAGASNINFILIVSKAATPRFVKFYDKATAPVVGTDVPKYTFPLAVGASPIQAPPQGFSFTDGFAYAIDLSVEDSGSTPFTVAGEVVMMLEYT